MKDHNLITSEDLPHYRSFAEMRAADERGEHAYVYAPDGFIEPTPPSAPHQPGDVVYLTKLGDDLSIPRGLINKPLTVISCLDAGVGDADIWDLDLMDANGTEVPFIITNEDVVTEKPF